MHVLFHVLLNMSMKLIYIFFYVSNNIILKKSPEFDKERVIFRNKSISSKLLIHFFPMYTLCEFTVLHVHSK